MIGPLGGLRGSLRWSSRSRSKRQLILEGLEDRITLTTDVWTGAAAAAQQDYSWSNANNWSDKAPQSGQDLIFPTATGSTFVPVVPILNDLANMTFSSIEIDAAGYTIGGDAISLSSAMPLIANYAGISAYNINTNLGANDGVSVAAGGDLDINGIVTGSKGLDLTGGGTISGTGQVPTLTVEGSAVQPGTLGVGKLSVDGIAAFDSASTFSTNITGPATYGTLFTTGSTISPVTLLDPTLTATVAAGYNPTPGTSFTIIQGAVVGGFNTLPEGSYYTPTAGGPTFQVTYDSGVVLTAVVPTTLSLSVRSGNSTSVFGQSVTFTATISGTGGTPTGTVTFDNNGVPIGTPVNVGLGGVTSLTTSQLPVGTDAITATYSGDTRFTSSTATAIVQTVDEDSTVTTVSSTANPSAIGQNVTFTAKVTPVSPGGGTPTGTVTFYDGTTPLTAVLLAGGVATYPTSTLTMGLHPISVVYDGDDNFLGSVSTTLNQNVNRSISTTTIASSVNPSTFGQGVTFTALVAASGGASGTPTGSVTFFDGITSLATEPLDGDIAMYSTTSLSRGSHQITAQYIGDSQFAASTSAVVSQAVNQANTTTAVTPSPAASNPGQSVTFTALVMPTAPGNGVPTGGVTFYDGSTQIGSTTNLSSGSASVSVSDLAVGSHSITADYAGDGVDFVGSISNPVIELVGGTTVALLASNNPITFGQSVTFTATVAAAAAGSSVPTGSVTFMDGTQSLGTFTLNDSGAASLTTASLSGGTHAITAVYGGATDFAANTSSETDEIVNQATTTTTVSPSVKESTFGQTVTFTATVTGFVGSPAGSVTFTDGNKILATVPVNAAGVAVYSSSTLAVGLHTLGFAYGGTASYAPSSPSSTLAFTVSQASTTMVLTSSSATPLVGQPVTFTATIAPCAGSPTGVVAFSDGSSVIGTVPVSGGVASLTVAFPAAGVSHVIVASYEGSTDYASSDSTGDTVSVAQATPTATLIVIPKFVRKTAKSVTLEVSVPAEFVGGPVPTGSVTFDIGKRKLRTVHLVNGSASVVVAVGKVTGQSVVGRYLGDTNYAPAASSTVHVTKKLLKSKPA